MNKKEFEQLKELEEIRHKNKMEEIKAETEGKIEVEMLCYEHTKEHQRIKSAEIRKNLMRQSDKQFAEGYWKK
jgi:hypothetical protein